MGLNFTKQLYFQALIILRVKQWARTLGEELWRLSESLTKSDQIRIVSNDIHVLIKMMDCYDLLLVIKQYSPIKSCLLACKKYKKHVKTAILFFNQLEIILVEYFEVYILLLKRLGLPLVILLELDLKVFEKECGALPKMSLNISLQKYKDMNASVKRKDGKQILESSLDSVSRMLTRKINAVKVGNIIF